MSLWINVPRHEERSYWRSAHARGLPRFRFAGRNFPFNPVRRTRCQSTGRCSRTCLRLLRSMYRNICFGVRPVSTVFETLSCSIVEKSTDELAAEHSNEDASIKIFVTVGHRKDVGHNNTTLMRKIGKPRSCKILIKFFQFQQLPVTGRISNCPGFLKTFKGVLPLWNSRKYFNSHERLQYLDIK